MPTPEGPTFFLLTEHTFHATYLAGLWSEAFGHDPRSRGVAVRADAPTAEACQRQREFHRRFGGLKRLTTAQEKDLLLLYPDASDTDLAMLELYGVPRTALGDPTLGVAFIGRDLNGPGARAWLDSVSAEEPVPGAAPVGFVFLDRILQPWWFARTTRILNVHSAVLPHARGMYGVEQVAASGDVQRFIQAAGATVHVVDDGVDTGPIVRRERLELPFAASSIWGCKAMCFQQGFRMLIEEARGMLHSGAIPSGTPGAEPLGPEYRRRDFTPTVRARAIEGYLSMKQAAARS